MIIPKENMMENPIQSKESELPNIQSKKIKTIGEKLLIFFMISAFVVALFALLYTINFLLSPIHRENPMGSQISRMSLTPFDIELAKKLMDTNNDGKCDACGMDVDQCIDSGQLQCNMASTSTMGILGSEHIHADFKVYINGNALDLSAKDHMTRMSSGSSVSSFIHVDSGAPVPEKTGDVLHMHATGIPLWIFFESIGMNFSKDCIEVDGEKYCNAHGKSLKFYVNGIPHSEWEGFVFKDLDKILISYGDKNEDLASQLQSITDFAKVHSKKSQDK